MLNYDVQYDIVFGTFLAYDKKLYTKKLHSNHSNEVKEKFRMFFPFSKFEQSTKQVLVGTCLYVILKKPPISFHDMMRKIKDVPFKEVKDFIYSIKSYHENITVDVNHLFRTYGVDIGVSDVFYEYQKKNIKFYTVWFYIETLGDTRDSIVEELEQSRIYKQLYRQIKTVMCYLEFKKESINSIEMLYNNYLEL